MKLPAVLRLSLLMLLGSPAVWATSPPERSIRVKGSDTMAPLVRAWGEAFRAVSGVAVLVDEGGTETGIDLLVSGNVALCAASRPMQADEVMRLFNHHQSLGLMIKTARDALSIYLHPENPVKNLTSHQLRGILAGEIRNWRDVGGLDEKIVLIRRGSESGTTFTLSQRILKETKMTTRGRQVETTTSMVAAVTADRAAIGYGGMGRGANLVHCKVDGIMPSIQNVRNGTYPLNRYLYLYTVRPPENHLKQFVDFILSEEGQRIVKRLSFIPLR